MDADLRVIAYRIGQNARALAKASEGNPKQDELQLAVNDLLFIKAQVDALRKGAA